MHIQKGVFMKKVMLVGLLSVVGMSNASSGAGELADRVRSAKSVDEIKKIYDEQIKSIAGNPSLDVGDRNNFTEELQKERDVAVKRRELEDKLAQELRDFMAQESESRDLLEEEESKVFAKMMDIEQQRQIMQPSAGFDVEGMGQPDKLYGPVHRKDLATTESGKSWKKVDRSAEENAKQALMKLLPKLDRLKVLAGV